jgi:hypothetical protein
MINGEGKIEILLEDFFEYVNEHYNLFNKEGIMSQLGVPKLNSENGTIEIDVLYDSEIEPSKWTDYEGYDVCKQWRKFNKKD